MKKYVKCDMIGWHKTGDGGRKMKGDTIAAISTAAGGSGIGIIRVSGSEAISVVDRVYRSKKNRKRIADQDSHTVHYGYIYDGDDPVDEVLVVLMRAPRSFTAEDTVEINCHGGVYAMKKVLDAVIDRKSVV